jgi:hypothetical protein
VFAIVVDVVLLLPATELVVLSVLLPVAELVVLLLLMPCYCCRYCDNQKETV